MGIIGPNVLVEETLDGLCDCLWGQNECPNQAEWILINLDNEGFAIMCAAHYENFQSDYPYSRIEVFPYSYPLARSLQKRAMDAGLI